MGTIIKHPVPDRVNRRCLPDSPKPVSPKPDSPKLGFRVRVMVRVMVGVSANPDSPKPASPKPDSPKLGFRVWVRVRV